MSFHVKQRRGDRGLLQEQAEELGVYLSEDRADMLLRFEGLLSSRAIPLGAVATSDARRIRERHVLDCLRAAPFVHPRQTACDLGSGAGLPGVVVAIAVPGARVRLIERRARRAGFLELVVQELELSNAEVEAGPAEDASGPVDACLARAFAPLSRAWDVAFGLLAPGGRLIYFAGASGVSIPEMATLETVVRSPVLESSGPLVIMARQ